MTFNGALVSMPQSVTLVYFSFLKPFEIYDTTLFLDVHIYITELVDKICNVFIDLLY